MVKDLTRGSPTRLIVSFAMTILLGSMMSYIYNLTDSLMLGHFVNADAFGAVNAASPFIMLINTLSFSTLSGASIVAGQMFGARDEKGLRRLMANSIYLTVAVIGLATAASLLLCRPVLVAMNTPDELLDMSLTYTLIILLAKPVSAPSWLLSGMFRALGDAKTPVYVAMVNGFGNVVFNFIFLVVFPMGIAGAALGTLCSALTGSIIYIIVFRRKMTMLHFGREDAALSMPMIKRLLGLGVPLGMEQSITTMGSVILQVAINGHGAAAVTGVAMSGKVMSLFWLLFGAFESAQLAFCAQNIGAGVFGRVKRGIRNTLLILLGIGAVFFLITSTGLDRYVYMAFIDYDDAIFSYAHSYLFTQIAFFPCIAVLFSWRAGLKSFGSTVPTVICGVIELIARISVSIFFYDNLQLLFFAGPMAWVGTAIFLGILYPIVSKRMERRFSVPKEEEAQPFAQASA